jgi:hypothetical protein
MNVFGDFVDLKKMNDRKQWTVGLYIFCWHSRVLETARR